ncbi:MAG: CobD/CbiB family protein [Rubrivivax sp.]|jgi:adenosylcobinamide-phosphate synthase|nr:CobD/CbiB family protein [Rubrivivax sp.]
MSFFAVLFALLIEQLRPMPHNSFVHRAVHDFVEAVGRNFDAGKAHHAWVVWAIAVLLPTSLVALLSVVVARYSLPAALVLDVVVLYLTLGFRQFSHHFTGIREALEAGNEAEARRRLADWQRVETSDLPRTELLRHVIETSLLAAHRHVFGVFFWFVLLSALGLGPAGAVLYRMAEYVARHWSRLRPGLDAPLNPGLRARVLQAFNVLDHIPARLTAFGFAVVGNFEEAINCWRRNARLWAQVNDGVILSAAAGAVGVALGGRAAPAQGADLSADHGGASTTGSPAQLGHLQSMVGLVWRSVILWMLLLALLTLASVVG